MDNSKGGVPSCRWGWGESWDGGGGVISVK